MGAKKGFVKGLAAGAILGAVASLAMSMKETDKKKRALQDAAHDVKDRVIKHSTRLGKLTKGGDRCILRVDPDHEGRRRQGS